MSAERHALNAALSYSAELEEQIKAMSDEILEARRRNGELRRQLSNVKEAVSEGSRPEQPSPLMKAQCQTAMPKDCPRCKNCGAPI